MDVYAGAVWRDGAFADGWVAVVDGVIEDVGTGTPPHRAAATGVVLPGFVNAHTHVGDHVARAHVTPGLTLAEAVAPPDGLKHRVLAATPRAELVAGMQAALAEAAAAGTSAVIDFRESGADGARALAEAARASPVAVTAFGRPADPVAFTVNDVADVLDHAAGLGLSALRDVPAAAARRLADAARAKGRPFALHFSEAEREDVDAALALSPAFIVHGTHCTRGDLDRVAAAAVPVVVCARSNDRLLGTLPPLAAMLDAGVPVALGSDNAMFQSVSVLDELRFLRERFPDVAPAALVAAAVDTPRLTLPIDVGGLAVGGAADVVVLEPRGAAPAAAVFAPDARIVARHAGGSPRPPPLL